MQVVKQNLNTNCYDYIEERESAIWQYGLVLIKICLCDCQDVFISDRRVAGKILFFVITIPEKQLLFRVELSVRLHVSVRTSKTIKEIDLSIGRFYAHIAIYLFGFTSLSTLYRSYHDG